MEITLIFVSLLKVTDDEISFPLLDWEGWLVVPGNSFSI